MELSLLGRSGQTGENRAELVSAGDAVLRGLINNETLAYYMARTQLFLVHIGVDRARLRFRQHLSTEMAHYAADWSAHTHLHPTRAPALLSLAVALALTQPLLPCASSLLVHSTSDAALPAHQHLRLLHSSHRCPLSAVCPPSCSPPGWDAEIHGSYGWIEVGALHLSGRL